MAGRDDGLRPFASDRSVGVGGLTFESSADRVSVYGSLDVTRTSGGLADAERALELMGEVVRALREAGPLPDAAPAPDVVDVPNPFGGRRS